MSKLFMLTLLLFLTPCRSASSGVGNDESVTKHFLEMRSKKPHSSLRDSQHSCHNETLFKCANGICILKKWLCDSQDDCGDFSDEYYCGKKRNHCPPNRFDCGSRSGQCYDFMFVCDGEADCSNGADEAEGICKVRGRGQCSPSEFKCANGRECIHHSLVCDNESNCSDKSDEAHCVHCSNVTQFACKSLSTNQTTSCIPVSYICDGIDDCENGQDEKLTICDVGPPGSRHATGDSSPLLLQDPLVSKTKKQTDSPASRCLSNQFRCRKGAQCISVTSLCDGRVDCSDASDEDDCNFYRPFFQRSAPSPLTYTHSSLLPSSSLSGVRLQVYDSPQTEYAGFDVVFRCRDEGDTRLPVRWYRLDGKAFPPKTTDINGRLSMFNVRLNDSGVYVCETIGAHPHEAVSRAQLFVIERSSGAGYRSSTPIPPSPLIGLPVSHVCHANQRPCKSEGCFDLNNMCDNYRDCKDGSDEMNCVAKCDYDQFRCANSFQCIMKREYCDGIPQCTDASDEFSCRSANDKIKSVGKSQCSFAQFQCQDGSCIPHSYQCDRKSDCDDASDEDNCLAPRVSSPLPKRIVARKGDSIAMNCTAYGLPAPTIRWRFNMQLVSESPRSAICTSKCINCVSQGSSTTSTLRVYNVRSGDSGSYTCEAENAMKIVISGTDTLVSVRDDN